MLKKILRYQREYGSRHLLKKVLYRYYMKYRIGRKYFPLSITDETRREQEGWRPNRKIKVSIAVPLYNTPIEFLRELVESVQAQTYPDWELCLVDASTEENKAELFNVIKTYSAKDKRICYRSLPHNDGIAGNTNRAIEMCTGEYIALADHDDILHPSALYFVMQEISLGQADFVYTDELSFIKKPGCIYHVHFKPDFSKESFRNNNYICHFTVFRRDLLDKVGTFREEFDGSQDYDLFLRLTERAKRIRHISKVLYYWRCHTGSVASQVGVKPYTIEAGRKAVEEHLKREGLNAEAVSSIYGPFYHIHYQIAAENKVLVLAETDTMLIRLKDQLQKVSYEIEVLSLDQLQEKNDMSWARWDMVVLLRDGYKPVQADGQWISALLECLQPKENYAVSPMVYDTSNKIYFAGYCYNKDFPEKIRPMYRGMPQKDPGYANELAFRQNVSLLGGAALAVKGKILQELYAREKEMENTGLVGRALFSDSQWFSICMGIKEQKGNCIVTPDASFLCETPHKEEYDPCISTWERSEWKEFMRRWDTYLRSSDPNMNPWMVIFGKYYLLW